MSAPAKRPRSRTLREGETLVVVQKGDPVKFRRLAAKLRAQLKPKRGESVARDLAAVRARNYR